MIPIRENTQQKQNVTSFKPGIQGEIRHRNQRFKKHSNFQRARKLPQNPK